MIVTTSPPTSAPSLTNLLAYGSLFPPTTPPPSPPPSVLFKDDLRESIETGVEQPTTSEKEHPAPAWNNDSRPRFFAQASSKTLLRQKYLSNKTKKSLSRLVFLVTALLCVFGEIFYLVVGSMVVAGARLIMFQEGEKSLCFGDPGGNTNAPHEVWVFCLVCLVSSVFTLCCSSCNLALVRADRARLDFKKASLVAPFYTTLFALSLLIWGSIVYMRLSDLCQAKISSQDEWFWLFFWSSFAMQFIHVLIAVASFVLLASGVASMPSNPVSRFHYQEF